VDAPTLTPAETAARTGLTIDTLRYYEKEGLVGPVGRASSGHRAYTDDDLFWIGLVTCLRDAGLGIAELREFTTLLRGEADAADRVAFLRAHRDDLEARVTTIQRAIGVLTDKIGYYSRPQG
jgi:DNA-binding transcriptional MerR regulator